MTEPSPRPGPASNPPVDGADDAPFDAEAEESALREGFGLGGDRRWWVVGGLGVLGIVIGAVIWGLSASVGEVDWDVVGQQPVSAETMQVRVTIYADPDRPVSCTARAVDETMATVGSTAVDFPAAGRDSATHLVEIRTSTEALTGTVENCEYAD